MGIYKFILSFSILLLLSQFQPLKAQTRCNTLPSQWLINYDLNNPANFGRTSLPKANKVFSVNAYICRDAGEQPVTTAADIATLMPKINAAFAPIGFSFNVCKVIDVPDYRYRTLNDVTMAELIDLQYQAEVINLYFTQSTNPGEGLTTMPGPGETDNVAVPVDVFNPNGEVLLIHQLGHFFGLYHTSGAGLFGQELADGSNCTTAGDLLCDTEADPDGSFVLDCRHQAPITDPAGNRYAPPYDNYMSVNSDCKCRFTNEQYQRMYNMYIANRNYLK